MLQLAGAPPFTRAQLPATSKKTRGLSLGLHRSEGNFGVHPGSASVLCNRDSDSTSPLNKVRWQAVVDKDGVPYWMPIGR